MHILRKPALLPINAPKTTHSTLSRQRERTTMAINAHSLVTADAMATSSLTRNGTQESDLRRRGLVIVAAVAVIGGELAAVGVEVVHVAHFDGFDALDLLPVSDDGRVDALAFDVMAWCGLFGRAWNGVGLWEGRDGLREFGP